MRADLLAVFIAYTNPMRWRSRLANYLRCEEELLAAGISLVTAECAYRDRPFELLDREGVIRVRVRGRDVLWLKENLLELAAHAAGDWQYGATLDGDTQFPDRRWASETVHALQLHPVVQISSEMVSLGPRGEHAGHSVSIVEMHRRQRLSDSPIKLGRTKGNSGSGWGYPGLAWAYRRSAFDGLGGLLDKCILGGGDHHMASGLLGVQFGSEHNYHLSPAYKHYIDTWGVRAQRVIEGNVGIVPGIILHYWHGAYKHRRYSERPAILQQHEYDPETDVRYDSTGLLQLAGNKPRLRDELLLYMAVRNEDDIQFDG
jgi:hypothetical protein